MSPFWFLIFDPLGLSGPASSTAPPVVPYRPWEVDETEPTRAAVVDGDTYRPLGLDLETDHEALTVETDPYRASRQDETEPTRQAVAEVEVYRPGRGEATEDLRTSVEVEPYQPGRIEETASLQPAVDESTAPPDDTKPDESPDDVPTTVDDATAGG